MGQRNKIQKKNAKLKNTTIQNVNLLYNATKEKCDLYRINISKNLMMKCHFLKIFKIIVES